MSMMASNQRNDRQRDVYVDGNVLMVRRGKGGGQPHFNRNRDDGYGSYRGGGSKGRSRVPEGHWRGGGGGSGRGRRPNVSYDDLIPGQNGGPRDKYQSRMERWRGGRGGGRIKTGRNFDNKYRLVRHHGSNPPSVMGWQKVTIHDGAQFNLEALMEEVQSMVGEQFEFYCLAADGSNVSFFLEDNMALAKSLTELSKRLAMPGSNHRLAVSVVGATPQFSGPTVENLRKVEQVLEKRYNLHMNRIDLSQFHRDPFFKAECLLFPLYNSNDLGAVGRLVAEKVPDIVEIDFSRNKLTSVDAAAQHIHKCKQLARLNLSHNKIMSISRLQKLQKLNITELNMEGNPLVEKYKKRYDSYVSDFRGLFPKLLILDGKELPPPIGFEEKEVSMPKVLPSLFINEPSKVRMIQFIEEYYKELQGPDRRRLMAAYCSDALFSVSFTVSEPLNIAAYGRDREMLPNRNLKALQQSDARLKLLFKGQEEIVSALQKIFPDGLDHDLSSFIMDIPVASGNLLQCALTGVYRKGKVEPKPTNSRFFHRSLIIVPQGEGMCIANEQLHITLPSYDVLKDCFKTVSPAGNNSQNIDGLEPLQLQMIEQFSKFSSMKPIYCKECLERSDWNLEKASELFTVFKNEQKIPENYFL